MNVDRVRVGDVLTLQRREVAIDPVAEYRLIGVYSFGKGILHREPKVGAELGDYKFFSIEPGDLILSNIQAWEGAIALAEEKEIGTVGTHRFLSYVPRGALIDTNWARWFFLSERGMDLIRQAAPGSTMRNRTLAIERFEALEIPLPPIYEQRRVALRLDYVMANEKRLGERRGIAEGLREALTESRVDGCFAEIKAPLMPVDTLGEVRGGIQRTSDRAPGANPVRYLTVAHVGRDQISFEDPRYFEVSPDECRRRSLEPGDVLIIEGNGSANQIGRAALFRGADEVFVHQNHVIRVRPSIHLIEPDFLNLYLNSPVGREAVQAQARTSSGLRSLSVGRIKQIPVPVPSLAEQQECVSAVRALQGLGAELARLTRLSSRLAGALVPSALNEAFAGFS